MPSVFNLTERCSQWQKLHQQNFTGRQSKEKAVSLFCCESIKSRKVDPLPKQKRKKFKDRF